MKVILLADVKGTGKKEQIVEVSDGYARNYLMPRGLAKEATSTAINAVKRAKSAEDHRESLRRQSAAETADHLRGQVIRLHARAGEKGRLYGSITNQEVADALEAQHGIKLEKRRVELAEPIRTIGEHEVSVWLYANMTIPMRVIVEGDP